jgi:hypothetical protein
MRKKWIKEKKRKFAYFEARNSASTQTPNIKGTYIPKTFQDLVDLMVSICSNRRKRCTKITEVSGQILDKINQ